MIGWLKCLSLGLWAQSRRFQIAHIIEGTCLSCPRAFTGLWRAGCVNGVLDIVGCNEAAKQAGRRDSNLL